MKGKWICFMICLGLAGLPAVSARAGEINASEQSVLSAVSQSFYYNGATYVVKDSYIEEGKAKLSSDDVDLTASQASTYIAQFQGSYQELVEDGYCDMIGEVSESSTTETAQPAHSKKTSKKNSLFLKTILGSSEDKTEKDAEKSDGESKQEETKTATATPSQEESWGEEADLGKVLTFEDVDRKQAKENKVTISVGGGNFELEGCAVQGDEDSSEETSASVSTNNLLNRLLGFRWWPILFGAALGITILSMGAAGWYIYKYKHGKHKRRKIRKWVAVAMGLSSGIWTLFILLMLTLYFGVYNKSAIQRQLMESDYFLGVTQMTRELAQEQLEEAGYSKDIAEEVFTLSSVYIEEKQYIENILKGKDDSRVSTERIQDSLNTEVVKEDGSSDETLIAALEETYEDMLQFPMATMIRESRSLFMKWFYAVVIVGVILILALFVMTYEIYDYLHKSARVYSVAMFVSSLLVTLTAFVLKMLHVTGKVTANPVYYEQFLQKYLSWDINVAFYVGCIGILASAGLVIWKRYLHMIYAE